MGSDIWNYLFPLSWIWDLLIPNPTNTSKVSTLVATNPRNNNTLKSMLNSQIPNTRSGGVETMDVDSKAESTNT